MLVVLVEVLRASSSQMRGNILERMPETPAPPPSK